MTGQERFASIVLWALRLVLAAIFLFAGVTKALDPIGFLTVVHDFDLLQDPWNAWLAMGLPWLEIITGVALLTPWLALGGSLSAAGMLMLFIGALVSAWARGMAIDCGCFGGGSAEISSYLNVISLRVFLLGLCGVVFWLLWHERRSGEMG